MIYEYVKSFIVMHDLFIQKLVSVVKLTVPKIRSLRKFLLYFEYRSLLPRPPANILLLSIAKQFSFSEKEKERKADGTIPKSTR